MLDIGSFLKAQKAPWVKRFKTSDNASWKAAPTFSLSEFLGIDTFKCNMVCNTKPKNSPHFYWQVIKSWSEIKNFTQPEIKTPMEIRRECLWLNKEIKINKKGVKWVEWKQRGINMIHDIVNENGAFLSPNEIDEKYNIKCNILMFNALKDAISIKWREQLKTMKIPYEAISFKENLYIKIGKTDMNINKITNKDLYWNFVESIQQEPIFKKKLQQELEIKDEEWAVILKIPSTVHDTKIQAFQYKLLFSLIPCNLYLNRIKRSLKKINVNFVKNLMTLHTTCLSVHT